MFFNMEKLAKILRKKRKTRGAIDFDFPETKVILDKQGKPIDIKPYDRNDATKLIEDFMLIANETVAEQFFWLEIPFLYRVHDVPDSEKIQKLTTFINNFGYSLKTVNKEVHPKEVQRLLTRLEGTAEEPLIARLTLRSMKQANYSTEATGHFGLACKYYSHFTSPIRRYPDLQIHRIMKEYLRGKMNADKKDHFRSILPEVAVQTSKRERVAQELERETIKMKQVEYMQERLGKIYDGVISGVTGWGIYVELPNTVEGMVHISTLPGDYYVYEEETYEIVGKDTGKTFKLGQPVKIVVKNTDKLTRKIDFALAEE
jgi:ribonuclease R